MKRKFTILFFALILGAGSAWAEDVTISSKSDWSDFAKKVSGGTTYSGQTVKLAADLEMGSEGNFASDYMVGNSETNSFQGTFDGQGHTIKITKTRVSGTSDFAPFRFIKNATIKNLITTGALDISSDSQKKVAGIVSMVYGTSSIQNCSSSMKLSRTSDGGTTAVSGSEDATIGGIIAYVAADATVTVTNVLFDGEIVADKGISGIIGYVKDGSSGTTTCTISNTLFAGVLPSSGSNIRNIYRKGSSNITVTATTNVYYKTSYNTSDSGTEATASDLLNGELAYKLASADNTGNTLFWGQGNLNKSNIDAYPSLTNDAAKKVVKVKINGMSTTPCVNPGGAAPNPCRFGQLGFKLTDGDANTIQAMPSTSEFNYVGTATEGELKKTTGMYCVTLAAGATTLILPFGVETLPEGITAYDIAYSSGDKVTATQVTKITANKPVLINGTAGTTYKFNGTFSGTFDGTLTDGVKAHTNGALTGVYVDANASSGYNPIAYVPKDSYVLQQQGDNLGFYKVATENSIKITSFRAYLTASASAREFLGINFDEGASNIDQIEVAPIDDDVIYDLSGRVIEHPTKGIYVKNGKKFIVK